MYKVNNEIIVRATDELNFIVSKCVGLNKKKEKIYTNICYFNSLFFLNEFCLSVYRNDMFEELSIALEEVTDMLNDNNKYIIFLNSFDEEDVDNKETLSCEIDSSDLSKCFKIFYNDSLKGYYPKLHQGWRSLLSIYILKLFAKGIELNKILKEIKNISSNI